MLRRCFLKSLAAAQGAVSVACAQRRAGSPPEPFKASEGANNPLGTGKGAYPGRVVWARDAKAATWDGSNGRWWDDANTSQKAVDAMTSLTLQNLTGRKDDRQAWEALFRNFNETHAQGGAGYRTGERVAIKLNCNQDRSREWGVGGALFGGGALNGLPSPHAVCALVAQLIERAGVRGEDILIYDATVMRNVGQPIYRKVRARFPAVAFLVGDDYSTGGRLAAAPDMANPVHFANRSLPPAYLPRQVTEAKYMINMALLRPHGMAGVTLTAKNHFGSICFPQDGGWVPRALHGGIGRSQPMGSYNPLVDLMGHRHLGGKTMLYVLDGIYSAEHNEGNVIRWASFGDQWAASLLMSQDPVAIDSVGLDILGSEPRATQVRGNVDNYLHEAARAAAPASGAVYKPDGSGRLGSLGTHEHWNNASERKYSRNLGRKEGIELIALV